MALRVTLGTWLRLLGIWWALKTTPTPRAEVVERDLTPEEREAIEQAFKDVERAMTSVGDAFDTIAELRSKRPHGDGGTTV